MFVVAVGDAGDVGDVGDADAAVVGSETQFRHPWRNLTFEEGPAGTKDCSKVAEWGLELLDSHLYVGRTDCSKAVDLVLVSYADPSARSRIEVSLAMELIVIVAMIVS